MRFLNHAYQYFIQHTLRFESYRLKKMNRQPETKQTLEKAHRLADNILKDMETLSSSYSAFSTHEIMTSKYTKLLMRSCGRLSHLQLALKQNEADLNRLQDEFDPQTNPSYAQKKQYLTLIKQQKSLLKDYKNAMVKSLYVFLAAIK